MKYRCDSAVKDVSDYHWADLSDDSDDAFVTWKTFWTLQKSEELHPRMRFLSPRKLDVGALLGCRWDLGCLGHRSLPGVRRPLGHPCPLDSLGCLCHLYDRGKKRDWMTLMESSPTFRARVTCRTFLSHLATIPIGTCDSLWTSVSMLSVRTHHRQREKRSQYELYSFVAEITLSCKEHEQYFVQTGKVHLHERLWIPYFLVHL